MTADRGIPLVKTCTSYSLIPVDNNDPNAKLRYTDCCGIVIEKNIDNGIKICVANGDSATYISGDGSETQFNFTQENTTTYANFTTFLENLDCACDSGTNYTSEFENLLIPQIELDFVGNQESYFIYWYEDINTLGITKLYMSAKFFDAGEGNYVKFSKVDQNNFGKPFNLSNEFFYYEVRFDYTNYEYQLNELNSDEVIYEPTWYEYVNPPIA